MPPSSSRSMMTDVSVGGVLPMIVFEIPISTAMLVVSIKVATNAEEDAKNYDDLI